MESVLEVKLDCLTTLVHCLANKSCAQACGICWNYGHPTNMCPTLQYRSHLQMNGVGNYQEGWFGPQSNAWYGNHMHNQQYQPRRWEQPQQSCQSSGTSLEELVKSLAMSTKDMQMSIQEMASHTNACIQEMRSHTNARIENLGTQMSQLAASIRKLESQRELPSQEIDRPEESAFVVTLKDGEEVQKIQKSIQRDHAESESAPTEKEVEREQVQISSVEPQTEQTESKPSLEMIVKPPEKTAKRRGRDDITRPMEIVVKPPFLERFAKSKKEEESHDTMKIFLKDEVSVPLLDVARKRLRVSYLLKMCAKIFDSESEKMHELWNREGIGWNFDDIGMNYCVRDDILKLLPEGS